MSFDIGDDFVKFEYLFRNIRIIIELSFQSFPEEYWEFNDIFLNEEVSQLADYLIV
jgi:hypothetical protein